MNDPETAQAGAGKSEKKHCEVRPLENSRGVLSSTLKVYEHKLKSIPGDVDGSHGCQFTAHTLAVHSAVLSVGVGLSCEMRQVRYAQQRGRRGE